MMYKKIIVFILLGTLFLSVASCGLVYIPNDEEKAFEELLPKLFEALDNKDKAAIYELFSPEVRSKSEDLLIQVDSLVAIYSGPTDEFNLKDVPIHQSEYIGNSKNWAKAEATIPVRAGEHYYFFCIDLMYENYDENQIGITQLDFYTADEFCLLREGYNKRIKNEGLHIYAENNLECEIRTIDSYPLRYTQTNYPINIKEVKEFIKSSCSFPEFVDRFGEANAKSPVVNYYYYELTKENDEPRYLCIGEHNEIIDSITIVDDFKFIEMIWENE